MKKTMYVPYGVAAVTRTENILRFRTNNTDYNYVSAQYVFDVAKSALESALARDASKELSSSRPYGHFGPYLARYDGEPKTPIPTKYLDLTELKVNNGTAWRSAKRTNKIVMSDFRTGIVELNYKYGSNILDPGWDRSMELNAVNEGVFDLHGGYCVIDGWVYLAVPFQLLYYQNQVSEEGHSPFEDGWSDGALTYLLDKKIKNLQVDGALVTTCLAAANSGTLDALTALAEAPETLRSIIDAAQSGLRLYKDARSKAFRVYNKAKGNSSTGTALKNSKELADALSQIWMTYRYNIMPNVYLIEDLHKTILTKMVEFVRFRESKRSTFSIPAPNSFTASGEFSSTERVLIKRQLAVKTDLPKLEHLVIANAAVTWWELVPLSFVADWFLNVGDVIAATAINPGVTQEGSTYSWKNSGSMVFTSTHPGKSAVSVTLKSYRRDVISPSTHTSLSWQPELNVMRYLDAIALGWSAFKKLYFKK